MGISKNLKTDYLAKGDGQSAVATLSITSGLTVLTSATPLWVPGDNNKLIQIYGIGDVTGTNTLVATMTYNSATQVTLSLPAAVTLSAVPTQIYWASDDLPSFHAFNVDAQASSGLCTLTIPAGIYGCDAATASEPIRQWMRFIPQLHVVGVGNPIVFGQIEMGCIGIDGAIDCSAQIAQAKVGDATLQLLNPSADAFKFTAGRTVTHSNGEVYTFGNQIMIGALDTQEFGAPPNMFYWEYANIASINAGTGLITLTTPLSQDGPYLPTYPYWSGPGAGDLGGPATIFAFDATWNCNIILEGVTISGGSSGNGVNGQFLTYKNCTFLGPYSPNASQNDTVTYDGCTLGHTEVDKHVNLVSFINGCNVTSDIQSQGSSVKKLVVSDSTVKIFKGTAKNTVINNCINQHMSIGVSANGRTDSFSAYNSTIGSVAFQAIGALYPVTGYTLVNGVIHYTGIIAWAVPGTRVALVGGLDNQRMFNVKAVTQPGGTGTPINVTTDLVGNSFPAVSGGLISMEAHPCPNTTFVNCTGNNQVIDLCNAGAQGKPIYSYSKRTYDQTLTSTTPGTEIWGNVSSIKITVNQAYAGTASTATFLPFSPFDNYPIVVSDYSTQNYGPHIDLKTLGSRTITRSSAPGLGLDSGLSLPDATMSWLPQAPTPSVAANYSDAPWSVTVEIITDQGFPATQHNMRGDF